jgi:hypothetical protein
VAPAPPQHSDRPSAHDYRPETSGEPPGEVAGPPGGPPAREALGAGPSSRSPDPGFAPGGAEPHDAEDELAPLAEKVQRILEEEARRHGVDV